MAGRDTERRVYLDHAATTPMRPDAIEAMLPYLGGSFGNPSGGHHESRRARSAVEDARDQVAACLGADLGEVVFTAGGTEADNLAISGTWDELSSGPAPPRRWCARPWSTMRCCTPAAPWPGDAGSSSERSDPTRTGSSISTGCPRPAPPRWGWCR